MKEYENRQTLHKMYVEEEMSQREIGKELGCSARTVGRKLYKYNIEARGPGGAGVSRAAYVHTKRGYVKAVCGKYDDSVYIHQLSAVAGGADPYFVFSDDVEVHHDNNIKWDNRMQNVEAKKRMKHQSEHIIGCHWEGVQL
jgi:hypothetical protein